VSCLTLAPPNPLQKPIPDSVFPAPGAGDSGPGRPVSEPVLRPGISAIFPVKRALLRFKTGSAKIAYFHKPLHFNAKYDFIE